MLIVMVFLLWASGTVWVLREPLEPGLGLKWTLCSSSAAARSQLVLTGVPVTVAILLLMAGAAGAVFCYR